MNIKQHSFVTEYLRFGDKAVAYRNAYKCKTTSYRTLESAANRLLAIPEIAEAIRNAKATIRSEVERELKEELRRELLTVQRKRELLAAIAEGDIYIEYNYKGKDCRTCTQLVKPTIGQMLKAIDLDNKLTGEYVQKKQLAVVHTAVPVARTEKAEQQEVIQEISPQVEVPVAESDNPKVISHAALRKLLYPQQNATIPGRGNDNRDTSPVSEAVKEMVFRE